jgi:hypothetical protein
MFLLVPALSTPGHSHQEPPEQEEFPEPTIQSIGSGAWTNPGIWSDGRVPTQDDVVLIGAKDEVFFNAASTEVRDIRVQGSLIWSAQRSTELIVGNIIVETDGHLAVGSGGDDTLPNPVPPNPISENVTATIKFRVSIEELHMRGGAPFERNGSGLWAMRNSYLDIIGSPKIPTWTKLAQDAEAGSDTLTLRDAPLNWQVGDQVLVTVTEPIVDEDVPFGFGSRDDRALEDTGDNEVRTITEIAGNNIRLDKPLLASHSGTEPTRGEVANLTRNVVFTSVDPHRRGHTLISGDFRIRNALFLSMGPFGGFVTKGRYAVHLHIPSNGSRVVEGNVVMNSGGPAVTIHGMSDGLIRDNVVFNTMGHGFYIYHPDRPRLERTNDNTFIRNLVVRVRGYYMGTSESPGGARPPIDDIDATSRPTAFWFAHPEQDVAHNVAVDAHHCFIGSYVDEFGFSGVGFKSFIDNEAHHCLEGFTAYYVEIPNTVIYKFKAWRNGSGLGLLNFRDQNLLIQDSLFYQNKYRGASILDYLSRDQVIIRDSSFIGNQLYGGLQVDAAGGEVEGPPFLVERCTFADNPADLFINSIEIPPQVRQVQVVVKDSELNSPTPIFMVGRTDVPWNPECKFCSRALSPTSFVRFHSTRFTHESAQWLQALGDFDLLPWWLWPDNVPLDRLWPNWILDVPPKHECPFVDEQGRLRFNVISPHQCK